MTMWNSIDERESFRTMFREVRYVCQYVPSWSGVEAGLHGCSLLPHYLMWIEMGFRDQVYGYNERPYMRREIQRYDIHPAVEKLIQDYKPRNGYSLMAEWPHLSLDESMRVAYTQNHDKGERDQQTVTTIGRYVTRHFDVPDHIVRDLVAEYTCQGDMQLWRTMPEMLHAINNGPRSCMADNFDIRDESGRQRHPYEVYNPAYGWHMAVRVDEGAVNARTLCMEDEHEGKYFVRSYKRQDGGYSHSDEASEAWLKANGYSKHDGWHDGALLDCIPLGNDSVLLPYLDGDTKYVDRRRSQLVIVDGSGDFEANNTDGRSSPGAECPDCGDSTDEDDLYAVGRWEDRRICCACHNDSYVYAIGENGRQYYERSEECTYIDGADEHYVDRYMAENDIVELDNGDLSHTDNATYVESREAWFDNDDERLCYPEDMSGDAALEEDCWQCAETLNWWSTETEPFITEDGETCHPDEAPETIEDETKE